MTNVKMNRSYILQSVISKNGSWNSDFNGNPKQYENTFFASDRTLKYAVRHLMEQMGKEVLIKKWVKGIKEGKKPTDSSEMDIMNQAELKKYIKTEKGTDFAGAFWEFEDVRQFGMLYDNLSLHGVTQISQGIDLYGQGITYDDELTGRMVFTTKGNSEKETKGMGSRNFLTEAHFVYDITVNPWNVGFLKEIEGYESCVYTTEDYDTLVECLEHGPRNVKSSQKLNCYTGLMLRVELNDDNKTLLGNLQSKIEIEPEKVNGKVVYNVSSLFSYLRNKQKESRENLYKEINITYEESEIVLNGVDEELCNVVITKY